MPYFRILSFIAATPARNGGTGSLIRWDPSCFLKKEHLSIIGI